MVGSTNVATDPMERVQAALIDLERAAYQRGLADGLAVADRIRGWLTRQPDRRWQAEVRGWADQAIGEARAVAAIGPCTKSGGRV